MALAPKPALLRIRLMGSCRKFPTKRLGRRPQASPRGPSSLRSTTLSLGCYPFTTPTGRIRHALRAGFSLEEIFQLTKIDRWFLMQIKELVDFEEELAADRAKLA